MIDTHCHLLHGLDDGPQSQLESIRMARKLAEFGVETVICTPHFSRQFPTPVAAASERQASLQKALNALGIGLRLELAAEMSPNQLLRATDEQLTDRAFTGGYLLVELLAGTTPDGIASIIDRLAGLGLQPVLAHPERCRAVQSRPQLLDEVCASGALVQVVASSLVGRSLPPITATAWRLIETGRADLLATDAHGPDQLQIKLSLVASLVEQRCGHELVDRLTSVNPQRLLQSPRLNLSAAATPTGLDPP